VPEPTVTPTEPDTRCATGDAAAEPTRDRILRIAADAWHANSYDGVGTAEICRRAEVHKGSFFHFFASKQALLLAVLEHYAVALGEQLRAGPFAADAAPLQRFARFFEGMGATVQREVREHGCMKGCPIGNLVLELATRESRVRQAAGRVFDEVRGVFEQALHDAVAADELPAHDVPAAAAAVLVWMQGLAVFGKTYGASPQLHALGGQSLAIIRASAAASAT
jgi:TetR/AcrR family transcriptional repressor of nem operon